MLQAFNTLVKPSVVKLEKTLGTKKIEVQYFPSEVRANYMSTAWKNKRIVRRTLQFDPLGYLSMKESR